MRQARFTVYRLWPPFGKTVSVHRITVGGFLEMVRTIAPKVAAAMVSSGKSLDDKGLIEAAADAETVSAAADLVCSDQPLGFMRYWLHGQLGGFFARRNTAAFLTACRQVEGDGQWTRFLSCLNRGDGKPTKGKGGGLYADVLDIARIFNVLPQAVMDMPLKDFLDLCDGMNMQTARQVIADPTLDPDAEASDTIPITGLWKVH